MRFLLLTVSLLGSFMHLLASDLAALGCDLMLFLFIQE
jgi:hypothetical protein